MSQHNLPKSRRLLKSKEFQELARTGETKIGKCVKTKIKKTHVSKLGISVSKKFGKANKRNSFKRIVKEAYRLLPKEVTEGWAIHISPLDRERPSFHLLKEELSQILSACNSQSD